MSKRAPINAGMRYVLRTLRRLNQIATKVPAEQLAAALLPHKRPGYCQYLGEYLAAVAELAHGLQAKRVCAHCGIQLPSGVRSDARYCDHICRQKAYRRRYASRAKDSDPTVTRYASPPTESERAVLQATERPR
jgi:hypothetical protein